MTLLRSVRFVRLSSGSHSRPAAPPQPVDLRLVHGEISEIGPALAARRDEDVVDLAGRWVIPGLWDAHVHLGQWAAMRRRFDVSPARSVDDAAALVTARLRAEPPAAGTVLIGTGYRDTLWADAPTAAALDDAAERAGLPAAAVVLVCGDLHSGWFSTAAARLLGARPGVLREGEWFAVVGRLEPPEETLDAWVVDAARAAAARGVVGVVDLDMADNLAAWRRRAQAGAVTAALHHTDALPLHLRVVAGVWREHLDGTIARELGTGDVVPGTAGLVRQGPLKVITDGSLTTRTACCHDPYPGPGGSPTTGVLSVPPDELVPLVATAARHGVHAALHAIGDRAVALALDAFAATGARGSIEHAQLVAPGDVTRMAALGVVASVQPEHLVDDRDAMDRLWADRAERCFPLRSLHAAGVRLALGSDAPVAPLDPWAAIAAAVTRTGRGRAPWHPEQALPWEVALAASVRSRVAVGQPADLAVLDADPAALVAGADGDPASASEALRAVPVAGTLLAGRWTHRAL